MRARVEVSDDRGETLLELLISIMILGISVVAIVGGFASSVHMSDVHRKQSAAGAAAHNYAEQVAAFIVSPGTAPVAPATTATGYAACAPANPTPPATSPYAPAKVGYTAPTGYTASVAAITYWQATTGTFGSACSVSTDQGAELVTVQVESSDQSALEKVTIVVRKPCRRTDPSC